MYTIVRVTNMDNKRSVLALVSDRGPFRSTIHKGCRYLYKRRIVDVSYAVAKKIGALEKGVVPVHVESLPKESSEFANKIQTLKRIKKGVNLSREFHRIYT